jgi:hypothetical protein
MGGPALLCVATGVVWRLWWSTRRGAFEPPTARLSPRRSHEVHLEMVLERCRRLLVGACSALSRVAGRLAFPASSLALPSARLPGRNGPSRSSARHRRPIPHRCGAGRRPSLRLHFGAPVCCPDRLTPISSPGVGRGRRVTPAASARRPSVDRPFGRLFRGHRCASTPGPRLSPGAIGFGMPLPKSRSVLVVSHHLDGFLRATARRLVASCCRPWGSPRFLPAEASIPRDATTPRRTSPTRRGLSRHRAPWPPWCSPSCEVVTFEAVSVESIP